MWRMLDNLFPDEQLSSEDKFIEGEEKEIENKDDNLKN